MVAYSKTKIVGTVKNVLSRDCLSPGERRRTPIPVPQGLLGLTQTLVSSIYSSRQRASLRLEFGVEDLRGGKVPKGLGRGAVRHRWGSGATRAPLSMRSLPGQSQTVPTIYLGQAARVTNRIRVLLLIGHCCFLASICVRFFKNTLYTGSKNKTGRP